MKLYILLVIFLVLIFLNKIKAIWIPNQGDTWNYVLGDEIDE